VFAQVLLADEINRAGPKTQSALLEAMEEQQVSVENETRKLPRPFFVIATQNPSDQLGTYPLPESQLDRFGLRITWATPTAPASANCWPARTGASWSPACRR
jgi:MoxR-like ATPase